MFGDLILLMMNDRKRYYQRKRILQEGASLKQTRRQENLCVRNSIQELLKELGKVPQVYMIVHHIKLTINSSYS